MTDRQVGQAGAQLDVQVAAARLLGQGGLTIDYQPYPATPPPRDAIFTRLGNAGLVLDVAVAVGRRIGHGGLLVEYVPGAVAAGIGWSGGVFQASGGATPVRWATDLFRIDSGQVVDWSDDQFVKVS